MYVKKCVFTMAKSAQTDKMHTKCTQNAHKMHTKVKKMHKYVKKGKRSSSKNWRLVIPSLKQYGLNPDIKSDVISDLKNQVLDKLRVMQSKRGLQHWCIAAETHGTSSYLHLDILLLYSKRVMNSYGRYDYLIKHGHLTRYRTINRAVLDYGHKEDSSPITNVDTSTLLLADKASTRQGLYDILQTAMLKKPFKFNADEYIHKYNLGRHVIKTSWQSIIRRIGIEQREVCNNLLKIKPGIRPITRDLIQSQLTADELALYDSWPGYQVIVDHVNQISEYGCHRPHKTKNLFLTGPPNTGKSSLIIQLEKHCAVYPLGTKHGWFPSFKSGVYTLLSWDEFNLRCYPYTDLLKLLEGRPMKLPIKGGHIERADNQLIICTSNLSLRRHIRKRFLLDEDRHDSQANLEVRFTEVAVTRDRPLFLLLKLIMI